MIAIDAIEPPKVEIMQDDAEFSSINVYVPRNSLNTYRNSDFWKNFTIFANGSIDNISIFIMIKNIFISIKDKIVSVFK